MAGSPGGQSKYNFSRYFLPSCESFISCSSSITMEVPFLQVFGFEAVSRLVMLGSFSIWLGVLFLFDAIVGI